MKKIFALATLLALLALTACSGDPTADLSVGAAELANELLQNCSFTDSLESLDSSVLMMNYDIAEETVKSAAGYAGTGATAQEIAVFEATDSESADSILEAAKRRIESRKEDFADYRPDEVPSLNNAIVERIGKYIVVCVSQDSERAREIVTSVTE